MKRAIQNWNMRYVDVVRGPGSALTAFTSSERLAKRPKTNDVGGVGKVVKKIDMGDAKARRLVKNVGTGNMKMGRLVKKVPVNDPKIEEVQISVRVGQEKCTKHEQNAMLAGVGQKTNS